MLWLDLEVLAGLPNARSAWIRDQTPEASRGQTRDQTRPETVSAETRGPLRLLVLLLLVLPRLLLLRAVSRSKSDVSAVT